MAWSEWKKFGVDSNQSPQIVNSVVIGNKITTGYKPTYIIILMRWDRHSSSLYYLYDFSKNTCRYVNSYNLENNLIPISSNTDITLTVENDGFTIIQNIDGITLLDVFYI